MGSLADAIDRMARAIEGEMLPTMLDIGQQVEDGAKTGHPWRNRTGRLERNIKHGAASGSLRRGYTVTVTAKTDYASYLEDGTSRMPPYAYLWPAWERVDPWATALVETVVADAITRS